MRPLAPRETALTRIPAAVGATGWLNPTVLGIGLASLCSDVGHEMATTAMPALLAFSAWARALSD